MEYEMIQHGQIQGLKLLLDEIIYRTPHMHREFELILIVSGRMTISTQGSSICAEAGSLVLLNPWQSHEFSTDGSAATGLFVQVQSELFRGYFPSISKLRFQQHLLEADAALQGLIADLARIYFQAAPLYEFSCMEKLNRLFSVLLQSVPWHILSSEELQRESIISRRMERIIGYVNENCCRTLFLEEIAQKENLSVSYLTHLIRSQLNMSFQELLSTTRLDLALKMLHEPSFSLLEISHNCGFSDPRYLKKAFERRMKVSIPEFRQMHKAANSSAASENAASLERIYSDAESLEYLSNFQMKGGFS